MKQSIKNLEQRLRRALADTHDRPPRPITPFELPFKLDRLITPGMLRKLRPAAVLAPVVRRESGLTVLLTQRAARLRSHAGQISFPGGRRDADDESAAHTALREAEEEVGIEPATVEIIGYLDDYPTITQYLVTPVVGILKAPQRYRPHEREVAEVFEVPLEFLLHLGSYEKKILSRRGLNVPFFEINYENRRIWGATAGMLWNLANKVARVS